MATSLSAQLQAIKSIHKGTPDPIRRPVTRPSILFDPKEAADLDLRTILSIALSGLEALAELDDRFGRYKDTLFCQTSLELDRGKMVQKEADKLNRSICSYLRLLSGNFELPAALKTVEYLIRRYEVHLFNIDDLVLCALPYHDTHAFVRIVQLLDLGDKKWAFLEGVKTSGAPPPRKVIVQQCIRDKGILETLCDYAKPTSEFQHARPVICFCTAVIVESLGSVPKIDTDTVKRALPFVFNGLNTDMKGNRDHKAGALMVVGLLATRATLAPKLIQNLVFFVARVAQHDAKQSADLPWIRVTIMAIVSLVQSQSLQVFPKKTMMVLKEIRDFAGILSGLSQEFNIQKFLCLYVETLVDYSTSDASYLDALINVLETLQVKEIVEKVVSKLLVYCMKLSHSKDTSDLYETGERAKKVLVVIEKHYPSELRGAVQKFLQNSKLNLREGDSNFKTFCLMFHEGLDDISDTKFWFSLEHPKADVRRAALLGIAESGILKDISATPQKLVNVQNAIVRRLHDDDLSVIQTALSVGLAGTVDPPCLLRAYREILYRCIHIINGSTSATSQACDVAVLCMERLVLDVPLHHLDYSKEVATIIFPLLLVLPKTWRVNLKALEISKQIQWPFYGDSGNPGDTSSEQPKILESGHITAINLKTIEALAETFRKNPETHIHWLVECSRCNERAKNLLFLIILQASVVHGEDSGSVLKLYQACSSVLRDGWHEMESRGRIDLAEEFNMDKFDKSCIGLVDQLLSMDVETLNIKIHVCIYWCILKACAETVKGSNSADQVEQLMILDELFLFFSTSPSKNIFRKHMHFLVKSCSTTPFQFLCKYFAEEGFPVEVQVESLHSLATLCSLYGSSERSSMNENSYLQFLLGFPSLLIPLSNANKDIRTAAANCIGGIDKLWRQLDVSRLKNGNDTILSRCLLTPTFGEFLESIVSHKELISSDTNFLGSFLMSMLSTSSDSLLVSENINKRFDQPSKDAILLFILSSALNFSSYGKLIMLSLFKGLGSSILHVEGVRKLLLELLERRNKYHLRLEKSGQELSKFQIETLCLLLVACVHPSNSVCVDSDILNGVIKALKVDGLSLDEPAVVQPCIAVLQNLTCSFYDGLEVEMQDELFGDLVFLFKNDNGDIRNAAREAVLQINFSCSTIVRLFVKILDPCHKNGSSKRVKREKAVSHRSMNLCEDSHNREETTVCLLGSLLDILLLKKHIEKRDSLVQPLFQVLEKLFSREWLLGLVNSGDKASRSLSDVPESVTGGVYYAQQTVLLILKDIIDDSFLRAHPQQGGINNVLKIDLLVECARFTEDVSTRNHVFLLLSSVARASPRWLSEHMFDIFTIIGESAVKQIDSHSQRIMEDLISTLVPCWLSETSSIGELLQIFIKALPDVPEHRRLTLIVYILRSLGEKDSLGLLIFHLFSSLIFRISKLFHGEGNMNDILPSSNFLSEWEYIFSVQLSSQYSCEVWFPCLVKLLQEIKMHSEHDEMFSVLHVTMQFILEKLEDTELFFQLESGQNPDYLQVTLGLLLEQVVLQLQLLNVRSKQVSLSKGAVKELKDCSNNVLKTITMWMLPSSYFKSITQLLEHSDGHVKKKALVLLCETVKDQGLVQKKCNNKRRMKQKFSAIHLDENATSSFNELCLKIVQLIACTIDSETPVKLAAISSLEVLSKELASENLIFSTCLACVVKYIGSADLAISSACIRSTGALINVLGSKALSHLPHIMKHMLERAHEISYCPGGSSKYSNVKTSDGVLNHNLPIMLSIIVTLEAIIVNLGGFLNPYLDDILDLIILHPEYVLESDAKIKLRAATVRKLLTEKIPVRLMLTPLLKMYSSALRCGESSLCLVFEMLESIIGVMDRPSIGTFHVKIFEQCLVALDIRCQCPETIRNVNIAEQSVINAMIVLTMKLTETMFRPLFIHSLEWADSKLEGSESINLDRAITFYKLVNELVEKHRSLFVPYFKYLLEDFVRHLTEDQDLGSIPLTQKRKKKKHGDANTPAKAKDVLSPKQWHLRALILKSLYQCFLYDITDLKFLDATNFQVLLKPIVSQIVVEPPTSTHVLLDIPTVEEVDETVVLCLGQMAVTARSDVLWKPLNHEVLMQTRNEKIRPKILGLKVVKYLVEHLKEEYLVFLPETIPFLGELLEDVELPVKTLAQEILKEMENLSGENLKQYL